MARLQIDMLPVGDADAFIIEVQLDGPPQLILLDGGKDWEDGDRVLRQLEAYYGGRVDHLVASHIDVDHVGGLLHIVENLEPDQIGQAWVHDLNNHGVEARTAVQRARRLAEQAQSTPVRTVAAHVADSLESSQRLIDLLNVKGVPVKEPFADGENRIGPLQVLGPTAEFFESCVEFYGDARALTAMVEQGIAFKRRKVTGAVRATPDEVLRDAPDNPESDKQASLILLLEYEGAKYLFPGDAGREGFAACPDLARAGGLHLLKVPNHGSKHNLSPELLDLFKPSLAYVSGSGIGIDPHPDLIAALKERGAVVYSTARSGNVWHRKGDVPERTGYATRRPM
ncbi:MAG: ComEC/Rec2 family competence protein [Planctomycetota bacterium]|jgi:beta-lactamase superfamily II metal-dependent hydrolase